MPKCDEVLASLLLSYPTARSLSDVSDELDLDNDTVLQCLKALQKFGLCLRSGRKWVIPKKSVERAKKYVDAIMSAEESLPSLWTEAIELRRYDRSLSIANRMITSGNPFGFSSKAISLLWLNLCDEAMMFAERSLEEAELHPTGWMDAAAIADKMNLPHCATTFAKVAMVSQRRMDASA